MADDVAPGAPAHRRGHQAVDQRHARPHGPARLVAAALLDAPVRVGHAHRHLPRRGPPGGRHGCGEGRAGRPRRRGRRAHMTSQGPRKPAGQTSQVIVNHVGLCVTDLDRPRRFYEDVLGFEFARELQPPDDPRRSCCRSSPPLNVTAVYLTRGPFVLELLHFDRPGSPPAPTRPFDEPGLTHISLSVEDLDAALALVPERGGQVVSDAMGAYDDPRPRRPARRAAPDGLPPPPHRRLISRSRNVSLPRRQRRRSWDRFDPGDGQSGCSSCQRASRPRGDHEALDLVGALADDHQRRVAVVALDREARSCSRSRRGCASPRSRSRARSRGEQLGHAGLDVGRARPASMRLGRAAGPAAGRPRAWWPCRPA